VETPPTVDDFRNRDFAGAFALFTDDQIEILMEDAMCMLGEDPWIGCEHCWSLAVIYAAMHLAATGAQGSSPGPMTSASAGGISASWGSSGASSTGWASTRWGQQVEALAAGCGRAGPFVITSTPTCC
jgi:hypothetical protein